MMPGQAQQGRDSRAHLDSKSLSPPSSPASSSLSSYFCTVLRISSLSLSINGFAPSLNFLSSCPGHAKCG
eukprot:36577-Eustigmatos_ZCMA.PRE.1